MPDVKMPEVKMEVRLTVGKDSQPPNRVHAGVVGAWFAPAAQSSPPRSKKRIHRSAHGNFGG